MRNPEDYLGRPVRSLQTMLRTAAKAEGRAPVPVTGQYGRATAAAVAAFQAAHRLPPTGRADEATWNELTDAFRRACVQVLPAEPLVPVWQPNQVIRPGGRCCHLYLIQAMLAALAERFPELPAPAVTGEHDEASVQAVRWVQEKAGLPATGEADRLFWLCLARLYRAAAGGG